VQRLERALAEAELTVVVVLDHCRIVTGREREQGLPPGQAQRHAERELVARRGVDQPGLLRQLVDDQSFGVDPHRHHPRAVRGEQLARGGVARCAPLVTTTSSGSARTPRP
jgi:hypothetical protein